MGLIEDLVAKVPDDYLRGEIEAAVAALKHGKRFGLVFEEHIPETSSLLDFPVRPDAAGGAPGSRAVCRTVGT